MNNLDISFGVARLAERFTSRTSNGVKFSWFILYVLVQSLSACREDVEVFAKPEFIPVVYCLLDPEDSVQTVRISRVFQDRRSQLEWQGEYDGYLADSLNRIYMEAPGSDGSKITTRFKWKEEIRLVNDTVFARTDLYTANLRPGYGIDYQLYVYYPEISKIVYGKTRTVTRVQLVDPALVPGRKVVIAPSQPYVIRWFGTTESVFFQGILDVNYLEDNGQQFISATIRIPLRPVVQYPTINVISQNFSGMHWLQSLRDQIPVRDSVRRKLADLDFTLYFGGAELALFANSGLNPKGPEGAVADFTNLENARGLFSSISSIRVPGIPLADQTLDTVALHEVTRNLNFLRSYEDFK